MKIAMLGSGYVGLVSGTCFSEFGFIIGTGILFSLVAMVVICPAFIILAERLNLIRRARSQPPRHLLRKGSYPLPKLTLAFGTIATLYSLYHIGELEFEYDFSKLKPVPPPSDNVGSLPQDLKEGRSPAIVMTENYDEAMEVVETVETIKAAGEDTTTILQVVSNPGRHLPYISCILIFLGLSVQFGIGLLSFTQKRLKKS